MIILDETCDESHTVFLCPSGCHEMIISSIKMPKWRQTMPRERCWIVETACMTSGSKREASYTQTYSTTPNLWLTSYLILLQCLDWGLTQCHCVYNTFFTRFYPFFSRRCSLNYLNISNMISQPAAVAVQRINLYL